jgi:uncharacterized protein (TIGR02147 family)
MEFGQYRHILQSEFEKRIARNAMYSLRSFARDLGLTAARLSEIFNEKQGLSKDKASEICLALGLNKEEKELFLLSVQASHARKKVEKLEAQVKLQKKLLQKEKEVSTDYFKLIEGWHHFAILELSTMQDFESDSAWIAKKLGITINEAEIAIDRLLRVGLLENIDGIFSKKEDFVHTTTDIPSESIKTYHKQILEKSIDALYFQTIEQRDFSSINFKINKSDIPQIKERIKNFRRDMIQEFSADHGENLYTYSTQLIRLDKDIRQ